MQLIFFFERLDKRFSIFFKHGRVNKITLIQNMVEKPKNKSRETRIPNLGG